MSVRTALKYKWTEFTPRYEIQALVKESTLLIIVDNPTYPDELKLQFEELIPTETLFYPESIKRHVMFALVRSLAAECGVQVQRRSGLRIAFLIFEDELQITSMNEMDSQERTTATAPSPFTLPTQIPEYDNPSIIPIHMLLQLILQLDNASLDGVQNFYVTYFDDKNFSERERVYSWATS